MPQVDLSPLFTPPSPPEPPPDAPADFTNPRPLGPPLATVHRSRLSAAQWTNVAFVVCACLGALFSVVYLFKGELLQLQDIAAWPRELFQGRAVAPPRPAPNRQIETGPSIQPAASSETDNSGDPFSGVSRSLKLDRFSLPPGRPNGSPVDPFSGASPMLPDRNVLPTATSGTPVAPIPVPSSLVPPAPTATTTATTAAETAQSATGSAAPLHQSNGLTKTVGPPVSKAASIRSSSIARGALTGIPSRSTRIGAVSTNAKLAKVSFFKSLFGFRPTGTSGSKQTSLGANRSKPRPMSPLAKAFKQVGARNGTRYVGVSPAKKIRMAQRSTGKSPARNSVSQKAGSPRTAAGQTIRFDLSSHIPQSSSAAASASTGVTSRTGINAGTNGTLRSFGSASLTKSLGNTAIGIGRPGIGAALGRGFGHGGGR